MTNLKHQDKDFACIFKYYVADFLGVEWHSQNAIGTFKILTQPQGIRRIRVGRRRRAWGRQSETMKQE